MSMEHFISGFQSIIDTKDCGEAIAILLVFYVISRLFK